MFPPGQVVPPLAGTCVIRGSYLVQYETLTTHMLAWLWTIGAIRVQPPTAIETERLILREWRDDDIPKSFAMNSCAEVMRYFVAPLTEQENLEMVERIRSHFSTHGFGFWAVELKGVEGFYRPVRTGGTALSSGFHAVRRNRLALSQAILGTRIGSGRSERRTPVWFRKARARRDRGLHRTEEYAIASGDGKGWYDLFGRR